MLEVIPYDAVARYKKQVCRAPPDVPGCAPIVNLPGAVDSQSWRRAGTGGRHRARVPGGGRPAGLRAGACSSGDHGIAKMYNRREISASCHYDRSLDGYPHPYTHTQL
eukprot:COSAG01_NODE_2109_length_8408_cov_33.352870_3_plen_108_part_00